MTKALQGADIANRIHDAVPDSVVQSDGGDVWIKPEAAPQVFAFLKDAPGLEFAFLSSITGVDYVEYFELVYHLTSLTRNHSAVVKTRCYGRGDIAMPSAAGIWRGADFQEREIWDLLGVRFTGHPNMKRILLWEGFPGHPLRKDYLGQEA